MTTLTDFQERYRTAFETLGFKLTSKHRMTESELALPSPGRFDLPAALKAYYLLAGRETQLNTAHNRLLSPEQWLIQDEHLIFMEENQRVLYWGIDFWADNADPIVWQDHLTDQTDGCSRYQHTELYACSDFLVNMIYVQACWGEVMKYSTSAEVPSDFDALLDQHCTLIVRQADSATYTKDGCALCFFQIDRSGHLYGGFRTRKQQNTIEKLLDISWEEL